MIYAARWGSHYATVAFKYAWQLVMTLRVLLRERPRAVLVMTPPVVACLPVWGYARLTGGSYVIDAHTGAFTDPRWRSLQWVQRLVSRRALSTLVTSEHLAAIVTGWGARSDIVPDVPVSFPEPEPVALPPGLNMVFVSTFTPDEPLEAFLAAARQVPDVTFHVTGSKRQAARWIPQAPANVIFTGYLPDARYVALLKAADAIICLTTLDHTMQRGAYEAVYLGRPVITSDFPLLRQHFDKGTVHVDATPSDIARGILEMRDHITDHAARVLELRREKLARWATNEDVLRSLVGRA